MKVLAFDTCCGRYSIAVLSDGKIIASFTDEKHNQQSRELMTKMSVILKQHNLKYQDFDYIAVTIGPGSFTGIRIGIAAAQGISALTNAPIIGITTLEAFAYQGKDQVVVAIDAGRGQYYYQEFLDGKPILEPIIYSMEEVISKAKGKKILGNINDKAAVPNAEDIAKLAFEMVSQSKNIVQNIVPFYIREPYANLPKG